MKKKKIVSHKKILSLAVMLALMSSSTGNVAALTVTDWSGLNTKENITFGNSITAGSNVIKIQNAPAGQVIDGAGFSFNGGDNGVWLEIEGGSPIIRNFGSIVDGTENSNTFSYTALDGSLTYKTIENSINGFNTPPKWSVLGAVNIAYTENAQVSNTVFYNNYSASTYVGGAALTLTNSTNLTVENSTFVNNTGDTGAAIMAQGLERSYIKNSVFVGNTAYGWDGGAINSTGLINYIENSVFEGNSSNLTGGAIWTGTDWEENASSIVIKNSIFKDNYAKGVYSQDGGGAIYADCHFQDDIITIIDTDFINNSTTKKGGAIYTSSTLNIIAENKDVIFSENKANNVANDIYYYLEDDRVENPEINPFVINVLATDGNKVEFGGGFVSDNSDFPTLTPIINLNPESVTYENIDGSTTTVTGAGEVEFSNKVTGFDVNLHQGTLSVGENNISDSIFEGSNLNVLGNATLDTANGIVGDIGADKVAINNGVTLEYVPDIDLASQVGDSLLNLENNGKILINSVNITSDTNLDSMVLQFTDGNAGDVEFKPNYYATTSLSTYKLSVNDDGDLLVENYAKTGGLAGAVYNESDSYSVTTIEGDQDIPAWISNSGNEVKSDLVVYGNDSKITSSTNADGLVVQEGVSLEVSNVTEMSGFDNAIVNEKGSVTLTDTSFANNTGDAVISNKEGDVSIVAQNKDVSINADSADNAIVSDAGSVKLSGQANIGVSGDVKGSNDATLTLAANSKFEDTISGMDTTQTQANVSIATFKDGDYTLQNGNLDVTEDLNNATLNVDGGKFTASGDVTDSIVNQTAGTSTINGVVSNSEISATAGNTSLAGSFDGSFISLENTTSVVSGSFVNSSVNLNGGNSLITGSFTDSDLNISNGSVIVPSNLTLSNLGLDGANISTVDGKINSIASENLLLTGDSKLSIDVDLNSAVMDTISAENVSTSPITTFMLRAVPQSQAADKSIIISELNYLNNDSTQKDISINFAQGSIKDYISADVEPFYGKIYKYNVAYDKVTGNFNFSAGAASGYSDYSPSVFVAPVAAQLGGYLSQLHSYDEAFRNMDMYMLMPKAERQALKQVNRIATTETGAFDLSVESTKTNAGWFRPYVTMERVNLNNGPKVSNVAYGSYFGADSGMYDLGKGWEGVFSAYAGYTGSHQAYQGNGIYQNGGTFGVAGMAYRDNFFTGLTLNAGASAGSGSTSFGNEDFVLLMSGIASKSGYNWELANGKFIIQPNMLLAYSFVHTFDYTNSAGLNISSDPLHAITIEPGVKFIGNLRNGWQPYAGISMVWNVMDKTHFTVSDVTLPNLSIDPFVKYGVGVRKTVGERFCGFIQTFITNGGRNGIGFQTGLRWAIGKDKQRRTERSSVPKEIKKIQISSI